MAVAGFFGRSAHRGRRRGWSRWLVPPAALSIHLAIGQAYAWGVLKLPLERSLLRDSEFAGTLSALPFTLGIGYIRWASCLRAELFGGRAVRGPGC